MRTISNPRSAASRRWLVATWVSGAILAASLTLGLGTTVWKMQETFTILDRESPDARELAALGERSQGTMRWSLGIGVLAFGVYLGSFAMYRRAR